MGSGTGPMVAGGLRQLLRELRRSSGGAMRRLLLAASFASLLTWGYLILGAISDPEPETAAMAKAKTLALVVASE
jgi:hypothetical protein